MISYFPIYLRKLQTWLITAMLITACDNRVFEEKLKSLDIRGDTLISKLEQFIETTTSPRFRDLAIDFLETVNNYEDDSPDLEINYNKSIDGYCDKVTRVSLSLGNHKPEEVSSSNEVLFYNAFDNRRRELVAIDEDDVIENHSTEQVIEVDEKTRMITLKSSHVDLVVKDHILKPRKLRINKESRKGKVVWISICLIVYEPRWVDFVMDNNLNLNLTPCLKCLETNFFNFTLKSYRRQSIRQFVDTPLTRHIIGKYKIHEKVDTGMNEGYQRYYYKLLHPEVYRDTNYTRKLCNNCYDRCTKYITSCDKNLKCRLQHNRNITELILENLPGNKFDLDWNSEPLFLYKLSELYIRGNPVGSVDSIQFQNLKKLTIISCCVFINFDLFPKLEDVTIIIDSKTKLLFYYIYKGEYIGRIVKCQEHSYHNVHIKINRQ